MAVANSASKSPVRRTPTKKEKSKPQSDGHSHGDHFEFGGPFGAVVLPLALIGGVYILFFGASKECVLTVQSVFNGEGLACLKKQVAPLSWVELFLPSAKVFGWVLCWFLLQFVLERTLPGDVCDGTVLANGQRLKYNVNGHLAFWVTLFIMLHGYPMYDAKDNFIGFTRFPLELIYDNYFDLAKSAIWFSTLLSFYLYAKSYARGALLAAGGDTSSGVYNWWIGRELNPRDFGDFDWKEFCELRPGLFGWCIINIGCALAQYNRMGQVTIPMILVNLFQGLYVWDAIYSEQAILTTMDITTDGFGFMLSFGDLAWVPFTYTLQARYLVEHSPSGFSNMFWVFVFAVKVVGFIIFRGANGEKDQFRRDPTHPSVSHIKTLETKRGKKLMITGWWGMARKINYTGDWLMGLSWCLTTGFHTPLTYFYVIYFFVLLVHRALRDDEACIKKYGEEDWARYKKAVPYIFIPNVV